MNEIQEDLPFLLTSFLNVAQNFAMITPYQNLWKQIGKIVSITFKIDFFALVSAKKTEKIHIKFTNNKLMVNRFIDKTKEIINSVEKNGFMAIEYVNLEEKYSTAFLPIEVDNSIEAVMIAGQKQEVLFPKITLNVFLAIAGLSGTSIERKRAEKRYTESEQQYRDAINSLNHPFYVIDTSDYTIKLMNSSTKKQYREVTQPITCYKLTHNEAEPCSTKKHKCPLEEVINTKKPATTDHQHCATRYLKSMNHEKFFLC